MYIYVITFIASLAIYYCIAKNNKKQTNKVNRKLLPFGKVNRITFALFLASLPPMIISALRYEVGTDYRGTYYCGFFRVMDRGNVDGFEWGYYWIVKLMQIFTDNPYMLFVVTSIIYVGMTYKSIEELSDDIPLSILLFFATRYYFAGMNGVRQFVALSILTYSIKYVIAKDVRKFFLYVFLASLFHYVSLLFIPVYFLGRLKLSKKRIALFVFADIVFFTLFENVLTVIFGGTKYGLLLERYGVVGIKFAIFTIVLNIMLFIIAYCGYQNRKDDVKYITYMNIQFFSMLVALVVRTVPLMERVYWVYSFPLIITFPYLLAGIRNKYTRFILKTGVVLVLLVYTFYDICVLADHSVLPYQVWIGKPIVHYSGFDWY